MKKIERALLAAAFMLFFATEFYAAPKAKAPKDLWVSKSKSGTVVTTGSDGWATLNLNDEIDFSGYKYIQVEASSADSKKFAFIEIDVCFAPEDDEVSDWDKSAAVIIRDIQKKPAPYQGVVFGGNKCYERWENDKSFLHAPESATVSWLQIGAKDNNGNGIPGVKVAVTKITATNAPLGKVHTVDLKRFLALTDKSTWDDGSKHYSYFYDFTKEAPKAGDVIQVKVKGTNMYDLGKYCARISCFTDDVWKILAPQIFGKGFSKGQSVNEVFEFPLTSTSEKVTFEFVSYDGDTKGPYIIVAE